MNHTARRAPAGRVRSAPVHGEPRRRSLRIQLRTGGIATGVESWCTRNGSKMEAGGERTVADLAQRRRSG